MPGLVHRSDTKSGHKEWPAMSAMGTGAEREHLQPSQRLAFL